jgi:hypothetical protein
VSFLRRILGPTTASPGAGTGGPTGAATAATTGAPGPDPVGDDEAARERDLLRAEAARLSDELLARQLRYADRSWTPPSQGGPRRADDAGAEVD